VECVTGCSRDSSRQENGKNGKNGVNPKIKIKSSAISFGQEYYRSGEKTSHFVSATIESEPGLTIDEFRIAQLEIGLEVAVAVIQNAVLRQSITEDEAKQKILELKENYSGMIARVQEKQTV
jgi:hypothetical protein